MPVLLADGKYFHPAADDLDDTVRDKRHGTTVAPAESRAG
jgi:hypothetical protein